MHTTDLTKARTDVPLAWGADGDSATAETGEAMSDNVWLTIVRDGHAESTFMRADEAEALGLALLKAAAQSRVNQANR